MLIRCDIPSENGIDELARCKTFGDFFKERGYAVAYAVKKHSYSLARKFLGEDETLFRIPEDEAEELDRIGHLHRVHGHRIVFVNIFGANSAYLFHLKRLFDHVIFFDHGVKYLIYADTILNPSVAAANRAYNCNQGARLLLGPKFHITRPVQTYPPNDSPLSYILLTLGNKEDPAFSVLDALASLDDVPTIHILCSQSSEIPVKLRAFTQKHPGLDVHPVFEGKNEPFPYERYSFIITRAGIQCLDFACAGVFFLTLAAYQDQLELAYGLNQLGVSPTLGWFPSKKKEETASFIQKHLVDLEGRANFVKAGLQLVDGLGLVRLASFIPKEERVIQKDLGSDL